MLTLWLFRVYRKSFSCSQEQATSLKPQAISKKALKQGLIKLSGTNLELKTNLKEVLEVRIFLNRVLIV
jgi:hypothetical protein